MEHAWGAGKRPIFYYPENLLNPRLVALYHGSGVDLERGSDLSQLRSRTIVEAGHYPYSSPLYDPEITAFYDSVKDQSQLVVSSLKGYVKFNHGARLGPKAVKLFRDFCEEVLPATETELDKIDLIGGKALARLLLEEVDAPQEIRDFVELLMSDDVELVIGDDPTSTDE